MVKSSDTFNSTPWIVVVTYLQPSDLQLNCSKFRVLAAFTISINLLLKYGLSSHKRWKNLEMKSTNKLQNSFLQTPAKPSTCATGHEMAKEAQKIHTAIISEVSFMQPFFIIHGYWGYVLVFSNTTYFSKLCICMHCLWFFLQLILDTRQLKLLGKIRVMLNSTGQA